jgi:CheY-like chemotaxis protein
MAEDGDTNAGGGPGSHPRGAPGDRTWRVLVVDDEPDICTLLRIVLEADGFVVVGTARDADEALELWRQQRPDVVLLDQQLPGTSGTDIARGLLAEAPDQRIVFLTANPERLREEAARMGLPVLGKDALTDVPRALRSLFAPA